MRTVQITFFVISLTISYLAVSQDSAKVSDANHISQRYQDGEELFFTGQVDNWILGEIYAISTDSGILIDFNSYIRAVDFNISSIGLLTYEGWYIEEKNNFQLIYQGNNSFIVNINGEAQVVTDIDITVINDVLYLSTSLIYRLFGIAHSFDETNLKLYLFPEQELPIQKKLAREKRKTVSPQSRNIAKHPQLRRGYEILSPQSLDLSLNSLYDKTTDNFSTSYSVLGGREVAYLNSRFFFSGNDQDTLSQGRMIFSKKFDLKSTDQKPLITGLEFGDVDSVSIGRGAFRSNSLGLVVTNVPTLRELNDDRTTTITGEIQEGWDVEIYRDDVLIDRALDVRTGRYIFPDILLFAGENKFIIIEYGPQGQKNVIEENRFVNLNRKADSSIRYRSSFTKLESSLLNVDNQANFFEDDIYDWSTQISRGIGSSSNINAGLTLQSGEQGINQLALGISSGISDRAVFASTYNLDDRDNHSLNLNLRTTYLGNDYNLTYTGNKNANSSELGHRFSALNRGAFKFDKASLFYQNQITLSKFEAQDNFEFRSSLGINTRLGVLSHNLTYDRQESNQDNSIPVTEDIRGAFNFRTNIGPLITRLGLGYSADDDFQVNNYNIDFSWSPKEYLTTRLNVNYLKFNNSLQTRFDLGYRTNNMLFSTFISDSDTLGLRAGLSARFSLGGEPFTKDVFATNRPISSMGSIVVRAFIDTNANAKFDDGEMIIPGVKIESVQSPASAVTDDNGLALLAGLSTRKKTDIQIVEKSIEEPFLKPIIEGVSVLPRQGFIDNIDYPLVYVSEIEGMVTLSGQSFNKLNTAISLTLVNESNAIVATTEVEFDGYYFISDILPGRYQLTVSQENLDRNDLILAAPISVVIEGESSLISDKNLTLTAVEYNKGYRVEIAQMRNLKILKAFWTTIKARKFTNNLNLDAFYMKTSSKYSLNVGFYQDENAAKELCLKIQDFDLTCIVEKHQSPKI